MINSLKTQMDGKVGYTVLTLLVVVADQWSKWWVEQNIVPGVPRPVIEGFLNLILVENRGVAFGLFPAGQTTKVLLLIGLGLLALGVVSVYFLKTPRQDRLLLTALALILGGAIGNLADRIAAGAVTDFIDAYYGSYHWYTFNVADSAISVGIGLMLLEIFRSRETEPAEAPVHEPASGS